jgi:hypothetical protein
VAGRVPRSRKPVEQLRRRNRPDTWTVLPAAGCRLPVPKWPTGRASADEAALWKRLWVLPVAAYWHATRIEPSVVARYVRLALEVPSHASVSRLETDLGLTPAALLRMRLIVEEPEPEAAPTEDPYAHLKGHS